MLGKILSSSLLFISLAHAQDWNYQTIQNWAGACQTGQSQSPINIENAFFDSGLTDLIFNWEVSHTAPFHNGHTIEVPYEKGSSIVFKNKSFTLKQFHFHSPSEHTLNGKSYPLEVHFVHADEAGKLLVVGVFVEDGKFNSALADTVEGRSVIARNLLPTSTTYYNYNGSLTTPPCSEGVTWIVLREAIEASKDQLEWLPKLNNGANNRPVMPINGREILTTDL